MKKLLNLAAVTGFILLIASCESSTTTNDAKPKHRADVETVFNMFSTGNTDGVEKFVDANYAEHTPPPGMEIKGLDGFKQIIKMNHDAFPDVKINIIHYVEQGDMVVVHYSFKGTNKGDMGPGMPATNKAVDCNGVDILKFVGEKCTEHWGYFEESKMMTQLGMMPPMDAAPPAKDTTKKK